MTEQKQMKFFKGKKIVEQKQNFSKIKLKLLK